MGTRRHHIGERTLAGVSDHMRRALEDFIACRNPAAIVSHLGWKPPTDVFETKRHIVVRMDIAGMNPGDIFLGFNGQTNTLTVAGKRTDTAAEPKIGYHHMEIIYGPFQREIPIPKPVDVNHVTPSYRNGFLEIAFPKALRPRTKVLSIRLSF